jgi:hypothetical protein
MRARRLHARRARGAAAVEFALVTLVIVPLLFGIIDFGFWFNDSLNLRQGVREGARRAVVSGFTACGGQTTDYAKLSCLTKAEIGSVSGPTYVKVLTPGGWVKGQPLVVCGMVKVNGATGFVPLPNNRMVHARTRMSIEQATATPTGTLPSDTPPAGADWTWCV